MTDSPIAAARALLPWWVPWGNLLVSVPAAAIASTLATWVASAIATAPLRKARRAGPLEPQEQARLEFPYWRSVIPVWIGSGLLFGTASIYFANELSRVPAAVVFFVVAIASWWVPVRVLPRRKRDPAAPRATVRQILRAVAFVAILFFRIPVTIAMCMTIGFELDATAWVAIVAGSLFFVLHWTVGFGFLLRILRLVRPASERLRVAVALAAERCHAPVPAAYEIETSIPSAFAVPASKCVVVTTRTLDFLDAQELASICTHEVAHLTEGRLAAFGRNSIDLFFLAVAFLRPLVVWIGFLPVAGLLVVSYVFALLVVRWTAARGETRADAIAHAADGGSGVYLAALEKIHREAGLPLTMGRHGHGRRGFLRMVFGRGGAHGSFSERAVALGVEPPRDARPPSRWRGVVARLAGVAVLATSAALALSVRDVGFPLHGDVDAPVIYLALGGDVPTGLVSFASSLASQGRRDDAVRALLLAQSFTEFGPYRLFVIAERLAQLGADGAARDAFISARARLPRSPESDADLDELEAGWSKRIAALEARYGTDRR